MTVNNELWTRRQVAEFFKVDYTTTYRIKGLDSCRAQTPGLRAPRFLAEKVRGLATKQKRVA